MGVVLDCLNDFLLQFEEAKESNYYSLPKSEAPIDYTFLKCDLFCHHTHEIRKHSKRHIRLSFRLDLNKQWLFSFEKFTLTGSRFLFDEKNRFTSLRSKKNPLSNKKTTRSTCFLTWILVQFWLVDPILQKIFSLNSFHWEFISHFASFQNSNHFPIFLSCLPTLLNMFFSV